MTTMSPHTSASIHDALYDLLQRTRVIAVVGLSPDPARPSHQVAGYLRRAGYDVVPVNPQVDDVDGIKAYASLADVPGPIDLVVVFRRPSEAAHVIDAAIARRARGVWLQQGIAVPGGEERARAAGLAYVENRCIMVEHRARYQ